jgi:hypothetical protein
MDSLQVYAALPPTRGELLMVLKRTTTRNSKIADGTNNTTMKAWLSAMDKQLEEESPDIQIVEGKGKGEKVL